MLSRLYRPDSAWANKHPTAQPIPAIDGDQFQARSSRTRGVSTCAQRSRWRRYITQRTDAPMPHAVLASALKGISPTPEFPEVEQAQVLLTALAP